MPALPKPEMDYTLVLVGFQSVGLCILFTLIVVLMVTILFVVSCRRKAQAMRSQRRDIKCTRIALFHPYCSSGGGGERVLWKIVQVLLEEQLHQKQRLCDKDRKRIHILIYTVDEPSPSYHSTVLQHVRDRFSIDLLTNKELDAASCLTFIHLHPYRHYLLPAKRLSLLVESFRTMQLAWKALTYSWELMPNIFMDTTGCAFTFGVARILMGCQVWAYVHYPTISTDMLQLVWEQRRAAYNHASYIAQSKVATYAKLVYYCFFAFLYGLTGSLAHVVLVNSTWTYNHIAFLWKVAHFRKLIEIVYPPCQVSGLQKRNKDQSARPRQNVILSIGQFRPEKDHVLQIEALTKFLELYPAWKGKVKLVLIGSCRGESDLARLKHLQILASQKRWGSDTIEFVVNQPYSVIQDWLSKASMGVHTMWNEHFGIGIVEMMAAGLLVMAHDSGGPRSDIVTVDTERTRTGFLATSAEQYAKCIHQILTLPQEKSMEIRRRAEQSALRFSDEVFEERLRSLFSSKIF